MKFIKHIFFLFTFIILSSCSKQERININKLNTRIDSIHRKIREIEKDSVHYYINKSNNLISSKSPDTIKAENYYLNGYYHYSVEGKKDTAFYYYNKAINFSKDSIKRNRELSYFLNLCYKYYNEKEYENGIYTIDNFYKLVNKKDYFKIKYVYDYKIMIYDEIKKYDSVIKYNNLLLDLSKKSNDTINVITSILRDINYKFNIYNKKDEAYLLIDSLLNNPKTIKYNHKKIELLTDKGDFKFLDKKYNEAYKSYLKSIDLLKSIKGNNNTNEIKIELTKNYVKVLNTLILLKKYKLARKYTDTINHSKEFLDDYYKTIFYEKKLKLNFLTTKNFNTIESEFDSIYNYSIKVATKKIDANFEALNLSYKKEKELLIQNQKIELHNQQLKKNQYVLFSILTFLLLGSIIGLLFFRQKKLQTSKDNLFMQQRLFRAQMNPHFTSNILQSIQSINKKDSQKANSYLVKFSRLLRLVLENSTQNYIAIDNEIEILTKYMDLQQLQFPNIFDYKIINNIKDNEGIKIPPMLIQPFVENAIKHAFNSIDYKGKIIIILNNSTDFINCIIEDNGIGFEFLKTTKTSSTKLIEKLIYELTNKNIQFKKKEKPLTGTIIDINIPYIVTFN